MSELRKLVEGGLELVRQKPSDWGRRINGNLGLLTILVLILMLACNGSHQKGESFDDFFEKFHQDSLFQMERIVFPLSGINTDDMDVDDTTQYYWQKEKWIIHRNSDLSEFEVSVDKSDSLVIEKISSLDNPGWLLERRFQMKDGKWYLVYYEDVNL